MAERSRAPKSRLISARVEEIHGPDSLNLMPIVADHGYIVNFKDRIIFIRFSCYNNMNAI